MANRINFTFEIDDKGRVKVDQLNKSFKSLDNAINAANKSLKDQAAALKGVETGNKNLISDAGLAGATLTELGRTISDANFGIRGMANNLSQLSSLFVTLVSKEGGGIRGVTSAFGRLRAQLIGPLGIILAFQAVIAFIENLAINAPKGADGIKEINNKFTDQQRILQALTKNITQYDGKQGKALIGGKALLEEIVLLFNESKGFQAAVFGLEDPSDEQALRNLVKEFSRMLTLEKQRADLVSAVDKDGKKIAIDSRRLKDIMIELIPLQEKFKTDTAEIVEDFKELTEETIRFKDVAFGTTGFDPNRVPFLSEYDRFLLENEGEFQSLMSVIFGLSSDAREKELKALRDKFSEATQETELFLEAVRLINKKYDDIEAKQEADTNKKIQKSRFDHFKYMLGGFSDFLNKTAELNEQNKDLARLSIIASAAAASVGIWEAWFVKDPEKKPGALKLAGAIATQAALVASTVAALRSLNSDTPITGEGGGSAGQEYGSPTFNVVGSSNISQLGQTIAMQRNQPIEAVVMESQVTNAQQVAARKAKNASVFS
mgnify:FL=1